MVNGCIEQQHALKDTRVGNAGSVDTDHLNMKAATVELALS